MLKEMEIPGPGDAVSEENKQSSPPGTGPGTICVISWPIVWPYLATVMPTLVKLVMR